jgi:hypothetical protein
VPTEGLLAEAVLKHDALCRTAAMTPKLTAWEDAVSTEVAVDK